MKFLKKQDRMVQGTWITLQSKAALDGEAKRLGTTPTHLASIMLENALKRISYFKKGHKTNENNSGSAATNGL